jgi:hypothetical protein
MESLSLPFAQLIIQLLGLPGLIFIIWHFDNKRLDKQREQYELQQQLNRDAFEKEHKGDRDQVTMLLNQYREDISGLTAMYKNNVHLVEDYEKMASALMDTVRLNTQATTMLTDYLKNRERCTHLLRNAGGSR